MSSVVAAALIGVGGSVIVAVVGFLTTRAITSQTITSAATSARESRLWDKRAAAYEAALSELARRLVRRQRAIDSVNDTSATVDFVAEYFATQDTPEWYEAEGRLLAYSSQEVQALLGEARLAERQASKPFTPFKEARRQLDGALPGVSVRDDAITMEGPAETDAVQRTQLLLLDLVRALNKAQTNDNKLIEQIRAELQGAPRAT